MREYPPDDPAVVPPLKHTQIAQALGEEIRTGRVRHVGNPEVDGEEFVQRHRPVHEVSLGVSGTDMVTQVFG